MTTDTRFIIAFVGRAGSGKTTACEFLSDNYRAVEMNFADPLKRGVAAMFGWELDQCYETEKKEQLDPYLGFSPRKALQFIGTEGVRNRLGHDVWVRILRRDILRTTARTIVIGDCRFDNEADMVRSMGGVVVHIVPRADIRAIPHHASEKGIAHKVGDRVLLNRGSLFEYTAELRNLARDLGVAPADRVT